MLTPEQAWATIVAHTDTLLPVDRALGQTQGERLAEPITADRDLPPADRSAMDGYAVRAADVRSVPCRLPVVAEVAAGSDVIPSIPPGACARIFTGANLPPGTDAVVMQENTDSSDDPSSVRILKSATAGDHVFRRAENAACGQQLLPAGARLEAAAVALCAAVGRGTVRIFRRPAVGILATGSELLDAAEPALPHQVRDSNGHFLYAALVGRRYPVGVRERVADHVDAIAAALCRLLESCDVVLLTGGVSVGRYDGVAEAAVKAGAAIRYHGIAMKPGKPQLFATMPGRRWIFGLPGNPVSAMNGFFEFVLPALDRLAGCPPEHCRAVWTVRLGREIRTKGDRVNYVPASLLWTGQGPEAHAVEARGSADLVAGARADGALIVPAGAQVMPAGAWVPFRPWRSFP